MPKQLALGLGIAFSLAGILLIAFGYLAAGIALVVIGGVFETLFAFALRNERRRDPQRSAKHPP